MGEVANILRGASPRPIKDPKWFDSNSKIGWIRISDVTNQHGRIYNLKQHLSKAGQDKTRVVYPPSLLLSIAASVGYPVITYIETGVHDGFVIFDKPKFNLDFMFFKLQQIQKTWNKYGQPGSQININSSIVSNTKILIPTNKEQLQISNILKKIEKCIHLQQRKLNDLNSMKSALLQDVFPNTQGIKKIKLSTQEWNLQKISSIFKERNQRNKNGMLLSVSISKGVYPFSENDRKDNSSNDKSNYKEVRINDLAYNSMRMWQGAVGVSKYNGIVSPAYTVITPKKEENPNFYYYYFKNKRMLFNFRQHSQGLTSDTWNLKFPLFEKILIQVPSDKEEEQRISSLFKQIDKSIELSKIQIKKLTSIKQFLLQNMFI